MNRGTQTNGGPSSRNMASGPNQNKPSGYNSNINSARARNNANNERPRPVKRNMTKGANMSTQNALMRERIQKLMQLNTQVEKMAKNIQGLNNRLSRLNSFKVTRNAGRFAAKKVGNFHGAVLNKRNSIGSSFFGRLRSYANKKASNYQAAKNRRFISKYAS